MLQRFRRNDSGSMAVEFAFIAPVLCSLCIGSVEFGLAFFTYNAAQQAAWDATRQVSTGRLAPNAAAALVQARLPAWAQSVQVPAPTLTNGVYKMTVSIPLNVASPIHFVTARFSQALVATASFQQEAN